MTPQELDELDRKGREAIALAGGTEDTSFERASAFAAESHFREKLAEWWRSEGKARLQSLEQELERVREWARQVSERQDVPKGIREAAKGIARGTSGA